MKIGIMQPYFLPYIGYWQLMSAVDKYVVYDNIKYTKKGWFNRNRFLQNGTDELFSFSLVKDSDFLDVRDRRISPAFNRKKLLAQWRNAYLKAPYFKAHFWLLEQIVNCTNDNLFEYVFNSIKEIHGFLELKCGLIVSSSLTMDHGMRGADKVKVICQALKGNHYINSSGGRDLYDKADFASAGITLNFIQPQMVEYRQFTARFIPWLSIVDVLMFNSRTDTLELLNKYELT